MISRTPRRLVVAAALAALTGGILGAAPASADQVVTPGTVRYAAQATSVENSFVVVLKNTTKPEETEKLASELTEKYGGTLRFTYTAALQGFALEVTEDKARAIAGEPGVDYVAQDQIMSIDALGVQAAPPSWGIDRIDQRSLPRDNKYFYANTAPSVRAYIIDTGILATHQEFGGRVICGFDPFLLGCGPCNQFHGTHVAGTVGGNTVGVAKGVQIVSVNVFGCNSTTPTSVVIAGVNFVTLAASMSPPTVRSVANMSLGGSAFQPLDDAVTASINTNVHYSVAAGNGFGQNACNTSPARTPLATTVGSTNINDNRSAFSDIGPCLDLFAPGEGITSSVPPLNNSYGVASGTSMSAPHATGVAALWRQKFPNDNAVAVANALAANATPGVVVNPAPARPTCCSSAG